MNIVTNSFSNIALRPIEFIKTQERTRVVTVALAALAALTVFALAVRSVYRHFTAQPKPSDTPTQFDKTQQNPELIAGATSSDDVSELSYTSSDDELSLKINNESLIDDEDENGGNRFGVNPQDHQTYSEGRDFYESGDFDAAIKKFEELEGLVDADMLRASLLVMENRTDDEKLKGKSIFEGLLDNEVYAANAHYRLGAWYHSSKANGEARLQCLMQALTYYNQAIQLFKDRADNISDDYRDCCGRIMDVENDILKELKQLMQLGQPSCSTDTGVAPSAELAIQTGKFFEEMNRFPAAAQAYLIASRVSFEGQYELLAFKTKGHHGYSYHNRLDLFVIHLDGLAKQNHIKSIFILANMYGFNRNMKNLEKAKKYYKRVMELGDQTKDNQMIEVSKTVLNYFRAKQKVGVVEGISGDDEISPEAKKMLYYTTIRSLNPPKPTVDPESLAKEFINKGRTLVELRQIDKAHAAFARAAELSDNGAYEFALFLGKPQPNRPVDINKTLRILHDLAEKKHLQSILALANRYGFHPQCKNLEKALYNYHRFQQLAEFQQYHDFAIDEKLISEARMRYEECLNDLVKSAEEGDMKSIFQLANFYGLKQSIPNAAKAIPLYERFIQLAIPEYFEEEIEAAKISLAILKTPL